MLNDFLKLLLKYMRGRVVGTIFSRFFLFQKHDKLQKQIDQERKRYKIYHLSIAQFLILQRLNRRNLSKEKGIQDIFAEDENRLQFHALEVNDEDHSFCDITTIASE